jgi:Fibrobacter succinogenes major domain (Fib_succ_major)
MPTRIRIVAIALSIAFGSVGAGSTHRSTKDQNLADAIVSSRPMADGKEWTTTNLNVNVSPSYCYDDAEPNCRRYGRLYPWESAQRVCQSLGDGWRLPTDDEWRQMAKRYAASAMIRLTKVERRSRPSRAEARQASMLCSGATAPMDSTLG